MPCPRCWDAPFCTALVYGAKGVTGSRVRLPVTRVEELAPSQCLGQLGELVPQKAALQSWLTQLTFGVELQLPLQGLEMLFFLTVAAILLHDFKPAAIGIHLGETVAGP